MDGSKGRRDQIFEPDDLSGVQESLDLLAQQMFWNGWNQCLPRIAPRCNPVEDQHQCLSTQRRGSQSGAPNRRNCGERAWRGF